MMSLFEREEILSPGNLQGGTGNKEVVPKVVTGKA